MLISVYIYTKQIIMSGINNDAWDLILFGLKLEPPVWIGLQCAPWLHTSSLLACNALSLASALGSLHVLPVVDDGLEPVDGLSLGDGLESVYGLAPVDGLLVGYGFEPVDGLIVGYGLEPVDGLLVGDGLEPVDGLFRGDGLEPVDCIMHASK